MYLKKVQIPAPQLIYAVRRPIPTSHWQEPLIKAVDTQHLNIEDVNHSLDTDTAYWEFLARIDDYTRRRLDEI